MPKAPLSVPKPPPSMPKPPPSMSGTTAAVPPPMPPPAVSKPVPSFLADIAARRKKSSVGSADAATNSTATARSPAKRDSEKRRSVSNVRALFEKKDSAERKKAPWQIEKEKRDAAKVDKERRLSRESLPKRANADPSNEKERRSTAQSVASVPPVFRRMGANPWNRDGDQFDQDDDDDLDAKDEIDEWGDGNELISHTELKRLRKEASLYKKKFEALLNESKDSAAKAERFKNEVSKYKSTAAKSSQSVQRLQNRVNVLVAALKDAEIAVPDDDDDDSTSALPTPGLLSLNDMPAGMFDDDELMSPKKSKRKGKKKKKTKSKKSLKSKVSSDADDSGDLAECKAALAQAKSDRKRLADIIATLVGGNDNLSAMIKSARNGPRSPPGARTSESPNKRESARSPPALSIASSRRAPLSIEERPPFVSHVGSSGHSEFNMRLLDEEAFSDMHEKRKVHKIVRRRKVASKAATKKKKTKKKKRSAAANIRKNKMANGMTMSPNLLLSSPSRVDEYFKALSLESQRNASGRVASHV